MTKLHQAVDAQSRIILEGAKQIEELLTSQEFPKCPVSGDDVKKLVKTVKSFSASLEFLQTADMDSTDKKVLNDHLKNMDKTMEEWGKFQNTFDSYTHDLSRYVDNLRKSLKVATAKVTTVNEAMSELKINRSTVAARVKEFY